MTMHTRHLGLRRLLLSSAVVLQVLGVTALAAATDLGPSNAAPAADAAAQSVEPGGTAVPAATAAAPEPTPPPPVVAPPIAPATTVAPPAPLPAPAPAPAPSPPPPPPPPPPAPPAPAGERLQASYEASVPAAWRGAITVRLKVIAGSTSWADHDGTISIGEEIMGRGEALLRTTIAHEFGHLIAFGYGSQAFNGAAPAGWPSYSDVPQEAWADCVSRVFTGVEDPSHGLPSCRGGSLSWSADWLGQGPSAHPETG